MKVDHVTEIEETYRYTLDVERRRCRGRALNIRRASSEKLYRVVLELSDGLSDALLGFCLGRQTVLGTGAVANHCE